MPKTKKKKRKGKKHYPWFEPTPPNPYSKKLKIIEDIVVGATEDGYEADAKVFTFFRMYGSIYVLVDEMVFKYQPKEEVKFVYMEEMYEQALGESIINKNYGYPDWMAYGWEELEEIKRLGIEGLEKVMETIPWDDDIELDKYYQDEKNFIPGDFTEAFVGMDEEQQNMFLSLLELRGIVEKLEAEKEEELNDEEMDIEINEEDLYMLQYGGTIIDGVYYTEEQRQWMDYWMANGNWEAVWEMQGLNDIDDKPKKKQKHPANIFNQEDHKDNIKIHEMAHQIYRNHRKSSGEKLKGKIIEKLISDLVVAAEKEGYRITIGQSKHYFNQHIDKLEKAYRKSTNTKNTSAKTKKQKYKRIL